MQSNLSMGAYGDIRPTEHNISDLQQIMTARNKTELNTLLSVNELASLTYKEVLKSQKRWNMIKLLSLIVSLMLLVITMGLLYTSPIIDQTEYSFYDIRAWGVGGYLAIGALLAAIVLDIGRSFILDRSNNSGGAWLQYIFFTIVSISFSTVGMLAIASFYASSNQSATSQSIDTARQYMIEHGSMASVTLSSLDDQQARFDKKLHTKKSGYYKKDHARDTARINSERAELKKYLSAKATVEGKQDLIANTDSSNWLYNTFATITGSTTATAGFILGVLVNLIAELMAMVAHSRLIKLNARLEITNGRWSSALMALDRAVIVNDSALQLVAGIDTFQHVFAMPVSILTRYQKSGVSLGDFVPDRKEKDDVQTIEVEREGEQEKDYQNITSLPSEKKVYCAHCNLDDFNAATEDSKPLLGNISFDNKLTDMKNRYRKAQSANKGDLIECPACVKEIAKKAHNTIFCSSKGADNCKDEYHNTMNPERIGARGRA